MGPYRKFLLVADSPICYIIDLISYLLLIQRFILRWQKIGCLFTPTPVSHGIKFLWWKIITILVQRNWIALYQYQVRPLERRIAMLEIEFDIGLFFYFIFKYDIQVIVKIKFPVFTIGMGDQTICS